MKTITIKISVISSLLLPFILFAQQKDLNYLAQKISGYLNVGIVMILSLAIVMFVWNIYKYFISGSDDVSSKKEAGLYVMWSVIGFFVILSFWGLVAILKNSLRLDDSIPSSGLFGNFKSSNSSSGSIFNQPADRNVNPAPSSGLNVNP